LIIHTQQQIRNRREETRRQIWDEWERNAIFPQEITAANLFGGPAHHVDRRVDNGAGAGLPRPPGLNVEDESENIEADDRTHFDSFFGPGF
jgi:hypothetical protein